LLIISMTGGNIAKGPESIARAIGRTLVDKEASRRKREIALQVACEV